MSTGLRSRLKAALLGSLRRLTRRHAVLLPGEARAEESILDLRAPYRVEGQTLTVELLEPGPGRITAVLLGYEGHFPSRAVWTAPPREYRGPCSLLFDLGRGAVALGGAAWGRVPVPLPGRRFAWRVTLEAADGRRRSRLTGHYLPAPDRAVEREYFQGENYVDHETQSAGDHAQMVALLQRHGARGPVLEVGCATGGLLAALESAGLAPVGLDISRWAAARAAERLGRDRVCVCDVERDPLPAEVKARGPFGALVFSSVFEHFHDPFAVLGKVTAVAGRGALLVITTTNADGLSRALFGPQWEGYFDWTHHGVDRVGVRALREELPRLGWRIAELRTERIWDVSADPTRATLRDWWAADARFRRLLAERDLGDLITCVAVKA